MLPSLIRTTFRHLRQNSLYASINVFGLAIGIAAVLLAGLYWKTERSFDNFHEHGADLYRITTTLRENKDSRLATTGGTGQVQGPAFRAAVPEVMDYARVLGGGIAGDVLAGNKGLRLQFLFADPSFFHLFSFPLSAGDPATALNELNSVVITESAAIRLFNTPAVLGRQVQLDADPSAKRLGKPMVITGVAKDLPGNSSLQFDLLLPMKFMQLSFEDNTWLNAYLSTFVYLHPKADRQAVIGKFNKTYSLYAKDQLAENTKTLGFDPAIKYGLQPLADVHLHPLEMSAEIGVVKGSSPVFSWLFMGIALFILLMASINFINISIADSLKRAKEIGIRKIAGGSRGQIILRFLFESDIQCSIAFILAVLLTTLSLPAFNKMTDQQIAIGDPFGGTLLINCIITLTGIILMTGLYPAWVLSGYSAREVLYSKIKLSGRNLFGKSLVVFQFSLAVFLLITTLVYYNQMKFIRTRDLGYNPHQLVTTQIAGDRPIGPIQRFMQRELAKEPAILQSSFGGGESVYEVKLKDRNIAAIHKVIDGNYLSALEIPLRTGRNLSPDFPTDSSHAVLVNEAFVRAAGLKEPLGVQVRNSDYFDKEPKTIVGVVKDYHTGSLREPIKPMVLFMSGWYGGNIIVKLSKDHQREGMAALEKIYRTAIPQAVYQYQFVDDQNARQYQQEQRWQQIIGVATVLSIAICCLGLFGLAHSATHQRIKEIGIRKVLGATVIQVAAGLSAGFLRLVGIAILIATPLAAWIMDRWLRDFAYRIEMGAGIFLAAGGIALSIALLAVSFQAMKAAMANPINSLRSD